MNQKTSVFNLNDLLWIFAWKKTFIAENAERRIRHYCTPLQIVPQKPKIKNYNEAL